MKDFGENFQEKIWRERKNFEREIFEKKWKKFEEKTFASTIKKL